MGWGSWMKWKEPSSSGEGLVTNNAKQRGWQSQSGRLAYERSRDLRRASGKKMRKNTTRPSEDPPRTWLLRGTRQVPVKTEEQPASLLKDAGAGKCLWSGVVPRSETRLPGQCSPRMEIRVMRKPLGHRHFPALAWLPHTLTASAPNATAPAAATGRRSRTERAPPHVTGGLSTHVISGAHPTLFLLCGPALGKMAAPWLGAPGLLVLSRSSRPGRLFAPGSRSFCSSATSSKPLKAQRLAEKLRAQKQEQKAKGVRVSLERDSAP